MFGFRLAVLAAFVTIYAHVAVATPPACLLAAVNTESHPADIPLLCGADSSKVQAQIKSLCGDNVEAALSAFRDTCKVAGKTISTEASSSSASSTHEPSGSSTSKASASSTSKASASSTVHSSASSTSESASTISSSISTSATSAPYPITYTSTFYDTECSCTRTTKVSSTAVLGSSGFVSATGSAGLAGATGKPGAGSGSSATGSPILPSGSKIPGPSSSSKAFTGSASKYIGSFSAAALAIFGLAVAL